ncbi:LysR family transcriptional regulator [Thermofilum sp.]|uniref:winged helix-turn-helix domain-containing protein n=1 Tax=Thermofilum sp. TaxID=1961369 RepID=UPI0025849A32|nr:LysR family transcriptional regulator [Thermofilum sp.]
MWFTKNGKPVLGKGGVDLLLAIDETGSLQAAAQKLGYSYSFAWSYLKKLEDSLGIRLVELHRGGATKGWARLTKEGRELLELYKKIETEIDKTVKSFE